MWSGNTGLDAEDIGPRTLKARTFLVVVAVPATAVAGRSKAPAPVVGDVPPWGVVTESAGAVE